MPQVCTISSEIQLLCPAPIVSSSRRRRQSSSGGSEYRVGFIMDAVSSVGNVAQSFPDAGGLVQVVEDPLYYEFVDRKREYKGEALVLNVSTF